MQTFPLFAHVASSREGEEESNDHGVQEASESLSPEDADPSPPAPIADPKVGVSRCSPKQGLTDQFPETCTGVSEERPDPLQLPSSLCPSKSRPITSTT